MRLRWIHGVIVCVLALSGCGETEQVLAMDREGFALDGKVAFVYAAPEPASVGGAKPWVWYAPALGDRHPSKTEQWMFDRLHAKGIAIAGIDVGESMGNPEGRAAFQKLYEHMVEQGYSKKPVLIGRSRGGLMHYNWAVEHPESVGGIAGIYPVCNLESWPGLKKAAPAYGMTAEQLKDKLAEHNPVDRLKPLAKAKVPVFHLQGDADRVVPLAQNTKLLVDRYKALGGPGAYEVIEGGRHDLERHWFESEALTGFMIECALADSSRKPEKEE